MFLPKNVSLLPSTQGTDVVSDSLTLKEGFSFLVIVALLALTSSPAFAYDPSPLQDTCVRIDEPKNAVFVNGRFCKNPNQTVAEDFFFQGLNIPGNTANPLGLNVQLLNIEQMPGLNTLGISLARIDYAPHGENPPDTHPRATEILTVLEGTGLYVGFLTNNPESSLICKVFNKGDVFSFPVGLIHFLFKAGNTNAVAIAALRIQNPGTILIANAVFGSNPTINPDFLAKAFQLEEKVVEDLEARF